MFDRDANLRRQLRELNIKYLHYMAPIQNIPSILANGILSYNNAGGLNHLDLANRSVQRQRRDFHDYVPLYFYTSLSILLCSMCGHKVAEGDHLF